MQDKKIVFCIALSILIILPVIATTSAFIHPDGSQDNQFEIFGPRIDKLVIKKYASIDAEMIALQNGEIDITDWALTKTWMNTFASDPNIGIADYGGEQGYYAVNFNHNNNSYLGNPPDPTFPNPVFPNPMSEPALRQACAHFINRTELTEDAGQGLYDPIYTPIPAYMTYWIDPEIRPDGTFENLTYPFDQTYAVPAALLDTGGFPMGPDGWRYWDMNRNNVKDAGEDFSLKVYERTDILRQTAAYMLYAGFNNPAIEIHYTPLFWDGFQKVREKDYHIYMIGWIYIGPEPDYLYDLYHWDNYYHDGSSNCPNIGSISINDPLMQNQLETIESALDDATILNACLDFQKRFAETASEIPLASTSTPKAYNKWYTGGNDGTLVYPDDDENKYRGHDWEDIVNERSVGENSWYTTLNAYPQGHPFGDGLHMTMRYGWKDNMMPQTINPLYAGWYWEWEILDRMYDTMAERNPYTMGPFEVGRLSYGWTVDTYVDPMDLLEKLMITVKLREDAHWSDGQPFTADDVIYTFVDLPAELAAKGVPGTWWQPTVDQISSVTKVDDYTVTFKMEVLSSFAAGWVLGNIIVPRHVLSPFITDPATTVSEIIGNWYPGYQNLLVGTGPFLLISDNPTTTVMTRNPLYYASSNPADLNHDYKVDIFDVVIVALAFGAQPEDPNWNSIADINHDEIVDIFDVVEVSIVFGWTGL